MTPSKPLVVSLGNPLLGADGLGAAVLDRLRASPGLAGAADLVDAGTDLVAHLETLAARGTVESGAPVL
jgi:Ni,Fe-hydrogenase maturation factor